MAEAPVKNAAPVGAMNRPRPRPRPSRPPLPLRPPSRDVTSPLPLPPPARPRPSRLGLLPRCSASGAEAGLAAGLPGRLRGLNLPACAGLGGIVSSVMDGEARDSTEVGGDVGTLWREMLWLSPLLASPSTFCLLGNIITSISSQVHLVCVICINCCQYLCFVYNLSIDISVPGTRKESKVWSILNVDNMHFT